MPPNWEWQWVIQEDNEKNSLRKLLGDDPRILYDCNGLRGGTAQTRNLGLTRATGSLIRVLDDDDSLEPTALNQDITNMDGHPERAWTCSRAVDILPDGTEMTPPDPLPPGPVPPGELFRLWQESDDGRLPVHPATLTIRSAILRAFGGWMAIPVSDDTGMLMAVSSVFGGYFGGEVSLRYRKSDFQITAQPWAHDAHNLSIRVKAIQQRVAAITTVISDYRGLITDEAPS